MKEGFNPSSEETPLRLVTTVGGGDKTKGGEGGGEFCPLCGVLDPRLAHTDIMEVPFQIGKCLEFLQTMQQF
jgi:hypothetical protein